MNSSLPHVHNGWSMYTNCTLMLYFWCRLSEAIKAKYATTNCQWKLILFRWQIKTTSPTPWFPIEGRGRHLHPLDHLQISKIIYNATIVCMWENYAVLQKQAIQLIYFYVLEMCVSNASRDGQGRDYDRCDLCTCTTVVHDHKQKQFRSGSWNGCNQWTPAEADIIMEQQLIQSECNQRAVAEANKAACTCKQWTRLRLLTRTVESAIFTLQSFGS